MARIRHVHIENFRTIKNFEWFPSAGINCLVGAGDSGKSTILDAIDCFLGARKSIPFNDADFFFLGYGQSWNRKTRDEALRNLVMSDPHSPPQYRVNGVVRNHDAWYAAFNVQPGDALYLAPADRVLIW